MLTMDNDHSKVPGHLEDVHQHPHPHTHNHLSTHEHHHPATSGHDHHLHSDTAGIEHTHVHDHNHGQASFQEKLIHFFTPHSHTHYNSAQDAALSSTRGIWAVKVSLVGLFVTALFQVIIVATSGSVALLGDSIHNFSDALTAIPLWLAFSLARRARNRRFTYGYGRAEDVSGVFIVLMILASSLIALYESVMRLIHPRPITYLGWVAAASIVGFLGNELVAIFRIRIGREIGSAALVADGLHARTDGITSLGVLVGVLAVSLGYPIADPIVGILIGVVILGITWEAAKEIGRRMMDEVDAGLVDAIDNTARGVAGVLGVHDIAARWVGHRQRCELHITVEAQLPTFESHKIAEEVRHLIFHTFPSMDEITIHVDPSDIGGTDAHYLTKRHTVFKEPI